MHNNDSIQDRQKQNTFLYCLFFTLAILFLGLGSRLAMSIETTEARVIEKTEDTESTTEGLAISYLYDTLGSITKEGDEEALNNKLDSTEVIEEQLTHTYKPNLKATTIQSDISSRLEKKLDMVASGSSKRVYDTLAFSRLHTLKLADQGSYIKEGHYTKVKPSAAPPMQPGILAVLNGDEYKQSTSFWSLLEMFSSSGSTRDGIALAILKHSAVFHSGTRSASIADNLNLMSAFNRLGAVTSIEEAYTAWVDDQYTSTYNSETEAFDIGPAPTGLTGEKTKENSTSQVKVTKVYRYKVIGMDTAPTFKQYVSTIYSDLINIEDERKYNNFHLKDWYTTNGLSSTLESEDGAVEVGQGGETNESELDQSILAYTPGIDEGYSDTYEGIKESQVIIREGTTAEQLKLKNYETELVLLYEYEPLVDQINLLIMRYTGQGVRASEQQIEFPENGIIEASSVPGTIIGAKYTTDIIPAVLESWDNITGATDLTKTASGDIQLVTNAKTVYLNVVDEDLFELN